MSHAYTTIDESEYRDIMAVAWNSAESRRVRELLGNEDIILGYDYRQECWLVAELRPTTVIRKWGVRECAHQERLPHVVFQHRDEQGTPLPVRDPRLIQRLFKADVIQFGSAIEIGSYT